MKHYDNIKRYTWYLVLRSVEEKNLWVSDLQKAINGVLDPKQPRLAWGLAPILLPETSIVSCPDCSVTFNFVINKKYHCRHW